MPLHSQTPRVHAIDPRGLSIRELDWHRSAPDDPAQLRVTRHTWDIAGQPSSVWDPRLGAEGVVANTTAIHTLSGKTILTTHVDAGWRLNLIAADGQSLDTWDGRGSHSRTDFDDQTRPLCVTETGVDGPPKIVERYIYGGASSAAALRNQCGRLIRHDDPAGTLCAQEFGLTAEVLTENRRFLHTDEPPDWPLDLGQRDALLEPGTGHTTTTVFDAAAALILQTDAAGNRTEHRYSVDGLLRETHLTLVNTQNAQTLISDLRYNPMGQLESERLGNGVITEKTYEPETGRLTRIFSSKAATTALQDLSYCYDPVGNLVEIEDAAQATRFFANQRIDPVSRYRYDTLYQLIEATGREVSNGASYGPALPMLQNLPQDPTQLSNYAQLYSYDGGGNLLEMRHIGAQCFTRKMLVAPDSNRSLPEGDTDANFEKSFDANGNFQQLMRGQDLAWDLRNQLRRVTAIKREDDPDDDEVYIYAADGQRCRKIRSTHTRNRTVMAETRYLPGLEIRTMHNGEILHVCSAPAGRCHVQVLHWAANKPDGIDNDQVRYSLNDHLGSSTLELDGRGSVISLEGYYPFGGTAWWAARNATDAKYKTVRYSGKERDASGLYYYGFRYYAPWLMRWVSPDPAEGEDGLNRYQMVANCPLSYSDPSGKTKEHVNTPSNTMTDVLRQHFEKKFKRNPEKKDMFENSYSHVMRDKYTIVSKYHPAGHTSPNLFINKFEPDVWTFKNNNKPIKEHPMLYANEIAAYQYYRVSNDVGFFGKLPTLIIRNNISNKGVKDVAHRYPSNTPEFTKAFLTQTQNGKSTQRIVDEFGLDIVKIEHSFNEVELLDIYVHVKSKAKFLDSSPLPGNDSSSTSSLRKLSLRETPSKVERAIRRRHSNAI